MAQVLLKISALNMANGQTQNRESLDWTIVAEYAEAMERGDTFPPIKVKKDPDGNLFPWDGFHRIEGRKKINQEDILADVEPGTLDEAILASTSANSDHGLRPTWNDKRRAVDNTLKNPLAKDWSDRKIAAHTHTSHPFVGQRRAALKSPDLVGKAAPPVSAGKPKRTRKDTPPDTAALDLMRNTPAASDPDQVKQLAALDVETQFDVAELIYKGDAQNVDEALKKVPKKEDDNPREPGAGTYVFSDERQLLDAAAAIRKKKNHELFTSSKTDEHPTDPKFWEAFVKRFGQPALDVCATAENAKAPKFYTKEDDGLSQNWAFKSDSSGVWMNPPYGKDIERWMMKAMQYAFHNLMTVYCLVPANTHTRWWYKTARFGEVIFLTPKLTFDSSENTATHGSALVIFHSGMEKDYPVTYWDWTGTYDKKVPVNAGPLAKGKIVQDRIFLKIPKESGPGHDWVEHKAFPDVEESLTA